MKERVLHALPQRATRCDHAVMQWRDAGLAEAVESMRSIEIDGVRLLVACIDGVWAAMEDRCTHAGCAFSDDGELDGEVVICNCHGSEFSLRDGGVLRGPASRPLPTFPVRAAEGRLEIGL